MYRTVHNTTDRYSLLFPGFLLNELLFPMAFVSPGSFKLFFLKKYYRFLIKISVYFRQEFGRIFGSLAVLASFFVNAKLERKKSDTGNFITDYFHTAFVEV
jgi:hypothetical protein